MSQHTRLAGRTTAVAMVNHGGQNSGVVATSRYENYKLDIAADIAATIERLGCQPILFVGSGLSLRYFKGPSWNDLLAHLAKSCPLIDKDYAYYQQTLGGPLAIGQEFARLYQQWAWGGGNKNFPSSLFLPGVPIDAYIKYEIARYLASITPVSVADIADSAFLAEINAMTNIRPHTIITTNYDRLLELIFPDYTPVIGQQIIRGSSLSVGEIFKIHGCVTDPANLVFTQSDYDRFTKKKKYLSAKLLTYFSEHPLLFVGYGAGDPNIQAILSDIDEALPVAGGVIPNVYLLEWRQEIADDASPARERLIAIDDGKSVRVKAIEAANFQWVFEAFGAHQAINKVSPKVLRSLLARSYDLVRRDIPRKTVEANFQMLEGAVASPEEFAKLFGITTLSDPSVVSARYPFILKQVADEMGLPGWNQVQFLIDRIKKIHGYDIKASDNIYHYAIKTGTNSVVHKYSKDAVDLFKKIQAGHDYKLAVGGVASG